MFELTDRVAAVTGGARGIGRAGAEAFAEMGADIALIDLNAENLARAKAEIVAATARRVETFVCDVTDEAAVVATFAAIEAAFGKTDVLFNSAGIVIWENAETMSAEQWDKVVNCDLKGTFLCCREAGKRMIAQGKGSIVNVASMSGHIVNTPQNQCSYNAAKAAVIQLTRSLATEWAQHGVRVNSFSPGYTATEMTMTVPEYHPGWNALVPMKRMGEPAELMGALVYLASDASSYTTGHDMVIDGGYCCW
jgi:NAD(P)-dependent dehydrogenase (short-subunit alcohol dehydrogenase family)